MTSSFILAQEKNMTVKTQLQEDLKAAMRAGDARRRDTIRLLLTAIKTAETAEGRGTTNDLTDEEVFQIITKQIRQRQDTAQEFERVGRPDAAAAELAEAEILRAYLPRQLTHDELVTLAKEVIAEVDARDLTDMGSVMRAIMPRIRGRADGRVVNQVVRELLAR